MAVSAYTILLTITLTSALDCVINNSQELSWEKQLQTDLTRGYDSYSHPPSNDSEPFNVRLRFILRNFQFYSQEEVFSLYTWMIISWTDERLKWDPTKYGGLNDTKVISLDIWVPTLRLYNAADSFDIDSIIYSQCTVTHNGKVVCVPRNTHETICSSNLSNWPYDRQKCSVIFGLFSRHSLCINMKTGKRAISMIGAEYGAEWTIVDYEQIDGQNSDKQLQMVFTVEREAESLAALIIYPSYIIIALNLATLLLNVRSKVRFYLVCFTLFCHYYFISELGQNIPKESIDSPTIILYYRGSEVLAIINFLVTTFLGLLGTKQIRAGKLISATNNLIYNSFTRFLIYPRWDPENVALIVQRLDHEDKIDDDWTKFANIINSMCIIAFVIVYICLYCAFMPQPHPIIY